MCKNLHFDVFNDGLKIVSRYLQEDHHIFIRPGSATGEPLKTMWDDMFTLWLFNIAMV